MPAGCVGHIIRLVTSVNAAARTAPDSSVLPPARRSPAPQVRTALRACSCSDSRGTRYLRPMGMQPRQTRRSRIRNRERSTRKQVRQETALRRIGSMFEWTSSLTLQNAIGIFIACPVGLMPEQCASGNFWTKKRPGGHPGPCSWWSRRELNPRPQALCRQFYMFIRFTLSFNLGSCQPTGPSLAIHINLRPC